jgi:hypothetical protein
MGEFEFKETYHKDAGPIVRWVATKILGLIHKFERPLYDYALMYEATWDEDEEDFYNEEIKIDLADAPNQMVLDWDEDLREELL